MIELLQKVMDQLGPDGWFLVLAFVAGLAGRLSKKFEAQLKMFVPYVAITVSVILSVSVAIALKQPVGTAFVIGVGAGGAAVGGHEVIKTLLTKIFDASVATLVLGKIERKP